MVGVGGVAEDPAFTHIFLHKCMFYLIRIYMLKKTCCTHLVPSRADNTKAIGLLFTRVVDVSAWNKSFFKLQILGMEIIALF